MNRILNTELLAAALPWITAASLVGCAALAVVHCRRLYKRWRTPPKALPKEVEDTYREMIRHENDLMNHRLTWLLTAEGLLFASLGFVLSNDKAALAPKLVTLLSFVGIMLAASASIVLDAADGAIVRLSPRLPENDRTDVVGFRGLPYVGVLSPWRVFPPMFICAWYIVSRS